MTRDSLRGRAVGLAIVLAVGIAVAPTVGHAVSLARFTDARTVAGNTFTTGTWSGGRFFLHNNPTPPTGNTAAQFGLAMNATAPTAGTLYNYDTNCDTAVGRDLMRTGNGATENRTCYYANWLGAVLASPLAINGVASLSIWSAVRNFRNGRSGALTAYLRDYNPGAGTYVTIVTATLNQANWQGGSGTWVQDTITFPSAAYTLAAGHRLELKILAPTAAGRTMWLAYDTAGYASQLTLP